jgi:type IV secretory pathway VirJ component
MKPLSSVRCPVLVLLALLVLLGARALPAAAEEETMTLEPFGTVTLYHEAPRPPHIALFISGDGGWTLGVVDMARELMGMDALVAGVDIRHYMKAAASRPDDCFDPAGDFAGLGRAIEKRLGYTEPVKPVLVGYSSGATLVYAAMVQAKPRTFRGGVSLGFCPDLFVHPPVCEGSGLTWKKDPHGQGIDFQPADTQAPWYALQGDIDKICTPEDTRAYVDKVPHGVLVWLPKVGHGFSVPKNWMRQFKESFAKAAGQE